VISGKLGKNKQKECRETDYQSRFYIINLLAIETQAIPEKDRKTNSLKKTDITDIPSLYIDTSWKRREMINITFTQDATAFY
jgi:hypothetical protein